MTEIERLRAVIDYLKISARKFAISLGYSSESIYLVLRGTDPLNDKILMRIKQYYPHINIEWLKNETGEMIEEVRDDNLAKTTDDEMRIKQLEARIDNLVRLVNKMDDEIQSLKSVSEKKSKSA